MLLSNSIYAGEGLDKVSLQLKWKYQFQFAGFIMAKEKGFYKDAGLDVKLIEFTPPCNINKELKNQSIDFGINDSSIILDVLKGEPLVAMMAIFQESPYILMSIKRADTKNNIHDLEGKKISLASVNTVAIRAMLESNNVNYIKKNPEFSLDKLENKEIDSTIAYISNEPFLAKEKGLDIVIYNPKDYGFDGYGDILITSEKQLKEHPERVRKMYEASKEGWEYAFSHLDETLDIIYRKYNTLGKSKRALFYEAMTLTKMSGHGKNFGEFSEEKINRIAQLFSFMLPGSYNHANLKRLTYKYDANSLNDEEREYLLKKGKIRVCIQPDIYPIDGYKDDQHTGIMGDILEKIKGNMSATFSYVVPKTYNELIKKASNNECDIITVVSKHYNTFENFERTSSSVGESYFALISKHDKIFVRDPLSLQGKRLLVGNIAHKDILKELYPYLSIDIAIDTNQAIEEIKKNQAYGFITLNNVADMIVQKYGYETLNINGFFGQDHPVKGFIGVVNTEPILLSIFNKMLKNIEPHTLEKIQSKWTLTRYIVKQDYALIWKILIPSFIVILVFMLWTYKLKKEIAKRKNAEKQYMESEGRFRLLFDNAPILLDAFDAKGRCTLWNRECEKVFGWSIDEINSHENPIELFYPDPEMQREMVQSLTVDNNSKFREWHPITQSGKKRVNLWANFTLPNGETISVGLDITKQRDAELEAEKKTREIYDSRQELQKLNTTLEMRVTEAVKEIQNKEQLLLQQARLAQMGEMISMIAHQWRQPLSVINITAFGIQTKISLEKFDFSDKKSQKKFLEYLQKELQDIHHHTEYLTGTIEDFTNYFKPNKEKELTAINTPIEKALKIYEPYITKENIQMQLDIGTKGRIKIYTYEVMHVILNIIKNSIDNFLEKNTLHPSIKISTKEMKTHFVIKVCDNGGGIDAVILPKIFDPYFSTKAEKNGTGIGLYMSKLLIEKHNAGSLKAYNIDNGVCFEIILKKDI